MNQYQEEFVKCLKQVEYSVKGINEQTDLCCVIDFLKSVREHEKRLFFIGNGGSAAIANHMTVDYFKNGGMKAISLFEAPLLTCLSNDYGYEYVFSKSLQMLVEEGDVLVAISSSGNSSNIVKAIETAKEKGAKVITLSGFEKDNAIRTMGDYNIYVPISQYGIVESIHNLLLQEVVDELMKTL